MPFTRTSTLEKGFVPYSYVTTSRRWTPTGGWRITPTTRLTTTKAEDPNFRYRLKQWNGQAGYKALLASQGYLPTLEYNDVQYGQSYSPTGYAVWKNKTPGTWQWNDEPQYYHTAKRPSQVSGSGWFDNNTIENLKTDAQVVAMAKAKDMKVNLPVMFGEGRQTVRMLQETCDTLGRAYREFRRRRYKQAARALGLRKPPSGQLASHWLAYTYGWTPLLSDAVGLVELASQQLSGYRAKKPRFTVKAMRALFGPVKYSVADGFSLFATGNVSFTGRQTLRGRAGLLLEVVFQDSALASQLGMGVTDPLLTVWELVPFSFVFDWFIGVGQWLESASALQGFDVKAGYTSWEHYTTDVVGYPSVAASSTWQLESGVLPYQSVWERRYYRQSWLGTIPQIRIRGLSDALNARRLMTSASLWRQLTGDDRLYGAYRP
jgi:hypothetical protein